MTGPVSPRESGTGEPRPGNHSHLGRSLRTHDVLPELPPGTLVDRVSSPIPAIAARITRCRAGPLGGTGWWLSRCVWTCRHGWTHPRRTRARSLRAPRRQRPCQTTAGFGPSASWMTIQSPAPPGAAARGPRRPDRGPWPSGQQFPRASSAGQLCQLRQGPGLVVFTAGVECHTDGDLTGGPGRCPYVRRGR